MKPLNRNSLVFRYWRIFKPFHKTFYLFAALIVLYESLQLFASYTVSLVIRLFGEKPDFTVWAAFFVALLIYDEVFMRLDNAVDWHVIRKHSYEIYRFLKTSAIRKFLEMDITWHQKRNSGALVGKVANGVEKVQEIMDGLSWEFFPTLIQTLLTLIPLLYFVPETAAISVVSFAVFFWLTLKNYEERKPYKQKRFDLYETEWHRSIEIVQSTETNLMFGQGKRLIKEQENLHDRIINIGSEEARRGIYHYNRWRIRALQVARRLILAIWVYQLYTGTLDIPNLIFVSVLTERLFYSFWRFARLIERASEASEGAERLADLLEEEKPAKPTGTVRTVPSGPVGISFKDVRFSYHEEYTSDNGGLHDLSLEIAPGSVVALVGPSGAGKTTIRKIVTGLIGIQGGSISVGGVDITKWRPDKLLELFSYVPQGDDVFLFNGTVKDNIAFAKPAASQTEVEMAAKLAGIHDFIMGLEDKYQTVIGERGKRLSGGQKQRLALARAIIADRPILILDEATSAVDAITEEEIQSQMRQILYGKTAIIIAHRLSTIWDISDKIVVLEKGRKVEEGTHDQLIALNGLYARMAALQTK